MFLALEGIDGSGKTTTMSALSAFLTSRGHPVYQTAEPTLLPTGRMIREMLKQQEESAMVHETLALLFAADRLRHLTEEVDPQLKAGKTVLTDRYLFSSLSYQSVRLSYTWVKDLNRFARIPDITLFIDVSIETALARIAKNREGRELFETRSFLERVRSGYERSLADFSTRTKIVRLNGELPVAEIPADIESKLGPLIPQK